MAAIEQDGAFTTPKPQTKPLEFRRAYDNYKKLTQSPEETEYVFEIIDALSTGTKTRDYDMMRRRSTGKRLPPAGRGMARPPPTLRQPRRPLRRRHT